MKKYVLSLAAVTILGMSYSLMNRQMDAHSNATGLTSGFTSCASGGCHGGSVLNDAGVMLHIMDGSTEVTSFTAGKTYMIHVMTSLSAARYGFALQASSGTLVAGTGMQKSTNYLTHTFAGTSPDAGGGKMWMAEWTAPSNGSTANFQLYLNAANGDGSSSGDKIYGVTKSLSLTTGIAELINEKSLTVYPNPVADALNIDFELKEATNVTVSLYDINGKLVKEIAKGKMTSGIQHVSMRNDFTPGIYMAQVNAGEQNLTRKVFVK